jgi:hypothetical protein
MGSMVAPHQPIGFDSSAQTCVHSPASDRHLAMVPDEFAVFLTEGMLRRSDRPYGANSDRCHVPRWRPRLRAGARRDIRRLSRTTEAHRLGSSPPLDGWHETAEPVGEVVVCFLARITGV